MMTRFPIVVLSVILAGAAGYGQARGQRGARGGDAAAQAPAKMPASLRNLTGNSDRGKDLFLKYSCYACHLYSGNGYRGAPGGARLVGLSLTMPAFIAYLRNPPNPARMPPFTAKLITDQQAADLYTYIKTLPDSPEAQDIPLLKQMLDEQK